MPVYILNLGARSIHAHIIPKSIHITAGSDDKFGYGKKDTGNPI